MAILTKLTLSDKTRTSAQVSPEDKLRRKLITAIDVQIAAAEAAAKGEVFIHRQKRWVDDAETGERVRKEVPVRLRSWSWQDESGKMQLEVRYGNKRLEIKPKKTAIEVGDAANLVPTLNLLREAIAAGELDKVLIAARDERSSSFKR